MKILIEIDTDTQRVVPVEMLVKLFNYIDPEPIFVNGKTMVFKNPMANYALTSVSRIVREVVAAPQPEPVDAIANFIQQFKRHVGGDGEFWLHELEDFYDAISQGEQK